MSEANHKEDKTMAEGEVTDVPAAADAPAAIIAPAATDAAAAEGKADDAEFKEVVEIEKRQCGKIIGSGGSTVQRLELESSCSLQIKRDDDSDKASIVVVGKADDVAKAKELIKAALEAPESPRREQNKIEVNLAGFKFDSREALTEHVQGITKDLGDDAEITGANCFFAFSLLSYHPAVVEKMGDGVNAIRFGVNEEFPDTKCFIVVRADESKVGFSWRKCVDEIFKMACKKRGREEYTRPKEEFVAGLVVNVQGVPEDKGFRDLKDIFNQFGPVRFVGLDRDTPGRAQVRFEQAEGAKACVDGMTDIDGAEVKLSVLSGEEETKFWEALWKQQEESNSKRSRGKGKGKGYRGKGKGKGKGKKQRRY